PGLLRAGQRMQSERSFPAPLGPVDLDDPAAGQAADAQRDVQRDGAGGDYLHRRADLVAEPHDRAPAELPFDLGESSLQGLVPVTAGPVDCPVGACHGNSRWIQELACWFSCRSRSYVLPPTIPRTAVQLPCRKVAGH